MADLLVWSGAAGLATGATWDDAFLTREDAALVLVSGDRIIEATDHAQAAYVVNSILSYGTMAVPAPVIRATRGAGADWTFAPATISDTDGIETDAGFDMTLGSGSYTGMRIVIGDDLFILADSNISLTKCVMQSTRASAAGQLNLGSPSNETGLRSTGTTWALEASGGVYELTGSPVCVGDIFIGTAPPGTPLFRFPTYRSGPARLIACDLSQAIPAADSTLFGVIAGGSPNQHQLHACKMPPTYQLIGSMYVDNMTIELYGCTPSGSSADCGYSLYTASMRGEVITDTGLYLTTGYVDDYDSTPLSHAMVPSSTDQPMPGTPLIGPWLYVEMTTTGVKNLAVELVENYNSVNGGAGNLSKEDIRLQVLYMGTLDVAALDLLDDIEVIAATATPTALTAGAGTAAWTGVLPTSAVSSKLEATVTVGNIGLYAVRVVLGVAPARFAATAELFYDPSVTVT